MCIDLRFGGMQVTGTCLTINCVNSNSCNTQLGEVCTLVPDEFGFDNISSVCVSFFTQFEFGIETCEQNGRVCPGITVCQEEFLDDVLFGTLCNVNLLNMDCSQVSCSENEECVTTSLFSSSQTIAVCFPNSIFPILLQILEALGLVEGSTTTPPNSKSMHANYTIYWCKAMQTHPFVCNIVLSGKHK